VESGADIGTVSTGAGVRRHIGLYHRASGGHASAVTFDQAAGSYVFDEHSCVCVLSDWPHAARTSAPCANTALG
jgi:hypothetical protein